MNEQLDGDREALSAYLALADSDAHHGVLETLSDSEAAILRSVLERLADATPDVQAHCLGGLVW